jgi:hypothetical protein
MKLIILIALTVLSVASATFIKRDPFTCSAKCISRYASLAQACLQRPPQKQSSCLTMRTQNLQRCVGKCTGGSGSPPPPPGHNPSQECQTKCGAQYESYMNQCRLLPPLQQNDCVAAGQAEYGNCVQRCQ